MLLVSLETLTHRMSDWWGQRGNTFGCSTRNWSATWCSNAGRVHQTAQQSLATSGTDNDLPAYKATRTNAHCTREVCGSGLGERKVGEVIRKGSFLDSTTRAMLTRSNAVRFLGL